LSNKYPITIVGVCEGSRYRTPELVTPEEQDVARVRLADELIF
jgi:hypothetical protein